MGVATLSNRRERRNAKFGYNEFGLTFEEMKSLTTAPQNVSGYDNNTYMFYRSMLIRKIKGNFIVTAPPTWDIDYILDGLILNGVICITDTPLGVVPLKCGVSGINVFDNYTTCNIANAVLGSFDRLIGRNCVALKLSGKYFTLNSLIDRFAKRLAMCDASIDINLINTRLAMVFDCEDANQAQTAKALYDKISQGEPAVFTRKMNNVLTDGLHVMFNNLKQNFIATDVQCEKRTIMEEFLTEIGINNCNVDKQARLNEAEVNSNNDELEVNTDMWRRNCDKGTEEVKAMYGIDFKIEYKKPSKAESLLSRLESEESANDDVS